MALLDKFVSLSSSRVSLYDRDYVGMGSATISDNVEIEFEVLAMVQINADGLTLDGVELLPVTHDMYFNDIEPDWMSDPDNYDAEK